MHKKGIDIQQIVSLYKSGKTPVEIGELLTCTTCNITRRLRKEGIIVKKDYSKRRFSRNGRYKVDVNYFDTIDSEDKAYFLGLLYSDGSVCSNFFYIKLADEDILQIFKDKIKYEGPIKYIPKPKPNWKGCYKLTINSKQLVQKLIDLGCTPNKTKTIEMPNIEENLIRHFIRGFFDGDGCLQLNNKLSHCRIDFTSASKKFLEQLRPIITQQALTNGYLGKESKYEVWHLNYSGQQTKKILNWLYKDSSIYMKRKHDKYLLLGSL